MDLKQKLYDKYANPTFRPIETAFNLKPRTLKNGAKFVHVSKPAGIHVQLLGKEKANKLVNAQGTYCKRCLQK